MHNTVLTSIALSLCLTLPAAAAVSYPLHDAVKAGKPSQVKATLDSSRVNQRNGADMTPLMVAAMYDRASSARSLLAAGARPDEATANYGTTALMMAAMPAMVVADHFLPSCAVFLIVPHIFPFDKQKKQKQPTNFRRL